MNRQERSELRDRLKARFEQLHQDEDWTQQVLAEEAKLPLRTVSDVLRSVSVPNERTLRALAKALGVSLTADDERAKWPDDIKAHLDLIALILSQRPEAERRKTMEAIAKLLLT